MRVRSQFALLSLLFLSPLVRGQEVVRPKGTALEIRLAKAPSWHDHYLEISITRVNHSKSLIFFPPTPFDGVEMYASVTQAKSTLQPGGQGDWILVYGWSDAFESEGKSLAPGRKEQNTYYIGDTFPVKDAVTNATRQVRLQGRLRIVAGYEQKVSKRRIESLQQKGVTRTAPTKGVDSGSGSTGQSILEIQIPCSVGAVNPDCLSPPPVFPGEHDQWTILPPAPVL